MHFYLPLLSVSVETDNVLYCFIVLQQMDGVHIEATMCEAVVTLPDEGSAADVSWEVTPMWSFILNVKSNYLCNQLIGISLQVFSLPMRKERRK